MQLYCVTFKVWPAKFHPKFWEWNYVWLHVWVFAADPVQAEDRAVNIAEQMPYEWSADPENWDGARPALIALAGGSKLETFQEKEKEALVHGCAFFVHFLDIGLDDSDVEKATTPPRIN